MSADHVTSHISYGSLDSTSGIAVRRKDWTAEAAPVYCTYLDIELQYGGEAT
jgi:hypothetical protein